MTSSVDSDEFSLAPQWLKTSHGLQSPGASCYAAAYRDGGHGSGRATPPAQSPGYKQPAADLSSIRQPHLSPGGSGMCRNHSVFGHNSLTRSDQACSDRERSSSSAWSYFHTSNRSSRGTPHATVRNIDSHPSSCLMDADRHPVLGSPSLSVGPTNSASRQSLQRSTSDSGGALGGVDGLHTSSSTAQRRDWQHSSSAGARQGSDERAGSQGTAHHGSDDKATWRDSSSRQQQQHKHQQRRFVGAEGHADKSPKPPTLTVVDFPSLTAATSIAGSSPGSSSSDRLSSPASYAPSVAPHKQDFLSTRGSVGWTSKLADVPMATGAPATAAKKAVLVDAPAVGRLPSCAGNTKAGLTERQKLFGGPLPSSAHTDSSRSSSTREGTAATLAIGEDPRHTGRQPQVQTGTSLTPMHLTAASPVAASDAATPASPSTRPAGAGGTPPGGVSLAETLKQAVAAGPRSHTSNTAAPAAARMEAQRRQGRSLVPLVSGSKAKHGSTSGSKAEDRAESMHKLTPVMTPSTAASGVSRTAAALKPSPPLGTSNPALTNTAGVDASGSKVKDTRCEPGASSSDEHTGRHPAAGVAAVMGTHQQLSDRHSFFAVLRQKGSSSSSHTVPSSTCAVADGAIADGAASSDQSRGQVAAAAADVEAHSQAQSPAGQGPQQQGRAESNDSSGTSTEGSSITSGDNNKAAEGQQCPLTRVPPCKGVAESLLHEQANLQGPVSHILADVAHTFSSSSSSDSRRSSNSSQLLTNSRNAAAWPPQDTTAPSQQLTQETCTSDTAGAEPVVTYKLQGAAGGVQQGSLAVSSSCLSQSASSSLWGVFEEAEEEAFLRSLGWTSSDDEGSQADWLTEEEITAFQAAAALRSAQQQYHHHHHHHPQQHATGLGKLRSLSPLLDEQCGSLSSSPTGVMPDGVIVGAAFEAGLLAQSRVGFMGPSAGFKGAAEVGLVAQHHCVTSGGHWGLHTSLYAAAAAHVLSSGSCSEDDSESDCCE